MQRGARRVGGTQLTASDRPETRKLTAKTKTKVTCRAEKSAPVRLFRPGSLTWSCGEEAVRREHCWFGGGMRRRMKARR